MTTSKKTHPSWERLKDVMVFLDKPLSEADLARKFNVLDQHVHNWKKRGVPKDILIDLADEWGFRIKYVRDGLGKMMWGAEGNINKTAKQPSAVYHVKESEAYQISIKDLSKAADSNPNEAKRIEELLTYFVALSVKHQKKIMELAADFYETDSKLRDITRRRARPSSITTEKSDEQQDPKTTKLYE